MRNQSHAPAPQEPPTIEHGRTCPKAVHGNSGGYLHGDNDDTPFDVDGLAYCGRCHLFLFRPTPGAPR